MDNLRREVHAFWMSVVKKRKNYWFSAFPGKNMLQQ